MYEYSVTRLDNDHLVGYTIVDERFASKVIDTLDIHHVREIGGDLVILETARFRHFFEPVSDDYFTAGS